jgi:hypothetical protein
MFSNGPYKDKETFILKLAGDKIPYNTYPKYLGVDESLCFEKNTKKIKEKCMSRLKIKIKVKNTF